jgi:hypothetical protein
MISHCVVKISKFQVVEVGGVRRMLILDVNYNNYYCMALHDAVVVQYQFDLSQTFGLMHRIHVSKRIAVYAIIAKCIYISELTY